MVELLRPVESELLQNVEEDLEVENLLRSDDVDELVESPVLVP